MKKSSELKEFSLSSWAIDHSTVIYVIIGLFFLLGISSYMNLPRENYPGAHRKENVGISNDNAGEKPAHRKTKVSSAMLIS